MSQLVQIPSYGVTAESIMRTAHFSRGVADRRAGRPPNYEQFTFYQADDVEVVKAAINAAWYYERGRQWACLAPLSMPLRVNGRLNRKAVALFKAARGREFII